METAPVLTVAYSVAMRAAAAAAAAAADARTNRAALRAAAACDTCFASAAAFTGWQGHPDPTPPLS